MGNAVTRPAAWARAALVLAGHGSSQHPGGSLAVRAHAEAIASQGLFAEVRVAFWKEDPALATALDGVSAERVYVVPVLASRGHITEVVLPAALGLPRPGVRLCQPVGVHPGIGAAVARHVAVLVAETGLPASQVRLLLVGHGSERNPASGRRTRAVAAEVAAAGVCGPVRVAFLEEPPRMEDWKDILGHGAGIVLPLMVSGGLHAAEDIPRALGLDPLDDEGLARLPEVAMVGPYVDGAHRFWYCRPLGAEPFIAEMILDQVAAAAP